MCIAGVGQPFFTASGVLITSFAFSEESETKNWQSCFGAM
jgi:hypothetical protein